MIERPWLQQYDHAPALVDVPATSLLERFLTDAANRPEDPCVVYLGTELTYASMLRLVEQVSARLHGEGLRPGNCVGIQLANSPAFIASLLAVWLQGGIAVLLNPLYRRKELEHILTDCRPRGVLCSGETLGSAQGAAETSGAFVLTVDDRTLRSNSSRWSGVLPSDEGAGLHDLVLEASRESRSGDIRASREAVDDVAVIIYTSGTTGPPKGAMLTHRNIAFTSLVHVAWVRMERRDRVLCIAPLPHVTGLVQGFGLSLMGGVPLLLTHRFDPEVVAIMAREQRATVTIAAPMAFDRLARTESVAREDLTTLRAVYAGGAPLNPQLIRRFQNRFGIYIHHCYGLTETSSPSHAVPYGAASPIDQDLGVVSIGVPIPNTDARIVSDAGTPAGPDEVGELQIRGPGVFKGYWENTDATAKALQRGWLKTGDVAYFDTDGWFYLVSRMGDVVNVGGYKVWPPEVETALREHEAIGEAVVVGYPDEARGSAIGAAVTAHRDITEAELQEHCIQRLAPFKRPRRVVVLPEIPRNPNGKVRRDRVVELFTASGDETPTGDVRRHS